MRITPITTRLCIVMLGLISSLGTTLQVEAQVMPTPTSRQALVDAMNAIVTAGVDDDLSVTLTDMGLQDYFDGCQVINPLAINFDFLGNGTFVLKRKIHTAGSDISWGLDNPSNELVNDLNAWLNAVWAMELSELPEFNALGWQCIDGGTPSDNRFYTEETTSPSLIALIEELSGEQRMLDKEYYINGQFVKGEDILDFSPTGDHRTYVRYMTDRGDLMLDEEERDKIRFLGNAYLKIDLPGAGGEFTFDLLIQTTWYQGNPCGVSVEIRDTNYFGEKALIDLVFKIQNTSVCQFGWLWTDAGPKGDPLLLDTEEEASERMFRYLMDHKGEWRHNPAGETGPEGRVLQLGRFAINTSGDLEFRRYYSDCCSYHEINIGPIIELTVSDEDEYCSSVYCTGGEFDLDPTYSTLVYLPPVSCPDCAVQPVPCIIFCDSATPAAVTVTGVLKADARKFTDLTPLIDEEVEFQPYNPWTTPLYWLWKNDYERGIRGKWRPIQEYGYRTAITPGTALFGTASSTPGNGASERNYNDAGTYELTLFNWRINDANDPTTWLNPAVVTKISPNGEPTEERDIFGIPSAAHFGYREQVPTLVAKNATYNSVLFESFEDGIGNDATTAHSGNNSFKVDYYNWADDDDDDAPVIGTFIVDEYSINDDDAGQATDKDYGGLLIRFWARQYDATTGTSAGTETPVELRFIYNGTYPGTVLDENDIVLVAKTGVWALYETTINGDGSVLGTGNLGGTVKIEVKSRFLSSDDVDVWIDDFRVQPMKSEMVCYVYDPDNLRQVTVLDDQHFGVFFQYNGEGKLIRKMRETERGMKTVQETQYHTPMVQREYASATVTSGALYQEGSGGTSFQRNARGENGARGNGTDFDILGLELTPDTQNFSVFGIDADSLDERYEELKQLFSSFGLHQLDLPDDEKLQLLDSLAKIESEIGRLEGMKKDLTITTETEKERNNQLALLQAQRQAILNVLDVSEEEEDGLMKQLQKIKNKYQIYESFDKLPSSPSPN